MKIIFVLGGHMYHHSGEAAGIIEPLDPKISNHLKTLIRAGYKRPKVLQLRASEFVRENFQEEGLNPYRRRFFPSRKMVKNMITRVKAEIRTSKIDQENIENLKDIWQRSADVHFSPR